MTRFSFRRPGRWLTQLPAPVLGLAAALLAAGPANPSSLAAQSAPEPGSEEAAVSEVLDHLHQYASEAAFEPYFDLYAHGAIFLGTDATERWTKDEFMDYTRSRFANGGGWTYAATARWIYVAEDEETAWFDERLDNAALGATRGSGVLVKVDGEWKISQYNLTIPIPNDLARDVVRQIRDYQAQNPDADGDGGR